MVFGDDQPIELEGDLKEVAGQMTKEFDKNFDMELVKVKKSVNYSQLIKSNDLSKKFGGYIEYTACTASKCIFPELALAFKFLSNADLVKHWGLLKLEPFLIIWVLVFLGLGLHLFGKIKFPHDSPIKKLGLPRMGLGVLSLLFMFYLLSGFRYNKVTDSFSPLTLLNGLAPPVGYSWIYPKDCPQDFNCFKDFDDGLAYAKKENKPILLDFTGHACVNCRKTEEHVWPKKVVKKYIADDFVLVSLYVDDKTKLPQDEQVVVQRATGGTRKLRTIGDKWQHFQTKYFKNNSQPYYVLLSPDGDLLNNPVPYTPNENEYAAFLDCGLQNFNNLQ